MAYKLHYFEYRGIAEPIRLLFSYAGVAFENVLVERRVEWGREWKEKVPMHILPLLHLPDGRQLSQSTAIAQYLGEEFGLTGETSWERAVAEQMVAGGYPDLAPYTNGLIREETPEAKKKLFDIMRSEFLDGRLTFYENYLTKKEHKFLVSNKVVWQDFVLYNNFFMAVKMWLEISLDEYPAIVKYCDSIENLPGVKEWLTNHPLPWTSGPYSLK